MTLQEILKQEIDKEYEQFRWIGDQQKRVFTVYSATVTAPFAVVALFAEEKTLYLLLPWIWSPLLIVGTIGIFVSFGLLISKAYQHRVSFYILELIIQLTELSRFRRKVTVPAIRFRQLRSNRGAFTPGDTGNIATFVVFVQGVIMITAGSTVYLYWKCCVDLSVLLLWSTISALMLSGIGYLAMGLTMQHLMRTTRTRHDRILGLGPQEWVNDLRENFLPSR